MIKLPELPYIVAFCVVVGFGAGYWTKGSLAARAELKAERTQSQTNANAGQSYDQLIAEKVTTDQRVSRDVSRINARRQEAKRREPTYREYLDSPVPAQSRELYRAVEAIDYGSFGADRGADGAARRADEAPE